MAALDSLGSPKREGLGLHLGPPDAHVASPFPLLQHADELFINEHSIPLVLTSALCQESQMKAELFVEMPIWKLCLGVRALPAAGRQGPR